MLKKIFMFTLCLLLLTSFMFAVGAEDKKTFSLKVGMVVTDQDPMYLGAMKLKEAVEAKTNGEIEIEVYPSSQLGDTKDMQEQAKTGANIAVITDKGDEYDV